MKNINAPINSTLNDHKINRAIEESILLISRTIHLPNYNKIEIKNCHTVLENLNLLKAYTERPSLNYLTLKKMLETEYNNPLEIDGVRVMFPFADQVCPSRTINYTLNLLKNG